MNRRSFLRGLAAVPVAMALPASILPRHLKAFMGADLSRIDRAAEHRNAFLQTVKSDPVSRYAAYRVGLDCGWMTLNEVRAKEGLSPLETEDADLLKHVVMKAALNATVKISELKLDDQNANKGTVRGRKALAVSLKKFGAGRSILLDKNGAVIAGNKTLEEAIARGDKSVQVVKTDGKQLIAVQRIDLDLKDPKAKGLAIADNRVAELDLSWDTAVLGELGKEVDLGQFFTDEEMGTLLADVPQLPEREKELRSKKFVRVLISVPVERAAEAKECLDQLAAIADIEIDYSAN